MVPQTAAISLKNGKCAPLNDLPNPKQNVRRLFVASPPTTIMVFLATLVLFLPTHIDASETVYMLARVGTCATLPAIYSGSEQWQAVYSNSPNRGPHAVAIEECKTAAKKILIGALEIQKNHSALNNKNPKGCFVASSKNGPLNTGSNGLSYNFHFASTGNCTTRKMCICKYIGPSKCTITDASQENVNDCVCGTNLCTETTGRFCYGPTSWCSSNQGKMLWPIGSLVQETCITAAQGQKTPPNRGFITSRENCENGVGRSSAEFYNSQPIQQTLTATSDTAGCYRASNGDWVLNTDLTVTQTCKIINSGTTDFDALTGTTRACLCAFVGPLCRDIGPASTTGGNQCACGTELCPASSSGYNYCQNDECITDRIPYCQESDHWSDLENGVTQLDGGCQLQEPVMIDGGNNLTLLGSSVAVDEPFVRIVAAEGRGHFEITGGYVRLVRLILTSNGESQKDHGGLIHIHGSSTAPAYLSIQFCNLEHGEQGGFTAQDGGGFIYVAERSEVLIHNTKMSGAMVKNSGGAIYIQGDDVHPPMVNITSSIVKFCGAENEYGGGIYSTGKSIINVQSSTFDSNFGAIGGAVSAFDGATLNVNDILFYDNTAATHGGAIYASGRLNTINIDGSKFQENKAVQGQDIYIDMQGQDIYIDKPTNDGTTLNLLGTKNEFDIGKNPGNCSSSFCIKSGCTNPYTYTNHQTTQFYEPTVCIDNTCAVGKYGGESITGEFMCYACSTGTYNDVASATKCKNCSVGKYQNETARTSCKACPAAKYLPAIATQRSDISDCQDCSPGTYNDHTAAARCKNCTSGKYQNDTASTSCKACPVGKNLPAGAPRNDINDCQDCLPGTYNDETAVAICKVCTPGQYQNNTASTACTLCPPGTTLVTRGTSMEHDELSDCEDCGVLQFNPFKGHAEKCYLCMTAKTTGSSQCDGCDPGKFKIKITLSDGNTTQKCHVCPSGYYSEKQNTAACDECPLGYFARQNNSKGILRYDRCQSCPRGTFGVATKAINLLEGCDNCTSGTYSEVEAVDAANKCKGCPKGKWSAAFGVAKESACINCGTGTYGLVNGSAVAETSCKKCGRGRFLGQVGASGHESCLECPEGFVQNKTGQAFCLPCTPGSFIRQSGAAECSKCAVGRASTEVARTSECANCTEGRYQSKPGTTACLGCIPGQYQSQQERKNCTKCTVGRASDTIARKKQCDVCTKGRYQSKPGTTACLDCLPGQHQNEKEQTTCQNCPSGWYRSANDKDRTQCLQCKIGETTGIQTGGATACIGCGLGEFGNASRLCYKCKANQYQDKRLSSRCKTCENEGELPNEGKTACVKPTYKTKTSCDYNTQYLNDTGKSRLLFEVVVSRCFIRGRTKSYNIPSHFPQTPIPTNTIATLVLWAPRAREISPGQMSRRCTGGGVSMPTNQHPRPV
jgi:predicted outer membrane repeat protein